MKTLLLGAAAAAAMVTGSAQAAEILTNGTFDAGNTGFYSEYVYNLTNLWAEGTYNVDNNPNNAHSLFSSFGDHTPSPDAGLMMVINGSGTPDKVIWAEGDIGGGNALVTAANTAFSFSFWLAKAYPSSPADLNLWINGTKVAGVNFVSSQTVGVWQQFTHTGVTGADGIQSIALTNNNLEPSGNDFALDDISLTAAVPEPATWAMMIAGFGLMGSALRSTRRRAVATA